MYLSKYYTCEEIDERLLQGYYDDAVAAGYEGTKEEFLDRLVEVLQNPRINADLVDLLPGTGLDASNAQQAFAEIAIAIYPLKVSIASSNAGNYEIGDEITPTIVLNITRHDVDISNSLTASNYSISPSGSLGPDHKTITDTEITSGTKTYQISVNQGGQEVSIPNQIFKFMEYRYRGAVSTKPANAEAVKTLCQNGTLSKELSTSTKMEGKNALNADKYYVFVIPTQSPNLIVKNANSGGTVDNDGSGTFDMARVNGSGGDSAVHCKYVIVPASRNSWNFEIVNS